MYAWIMWMWMNKWYSFCAWSLHHPNISVFKIFFFHLFEREREWERNFPPTRSPLMHLEQLGLGKDQDLGLSLGHTHGLQGVMKHMSCHLLPPRAHISRELVDNQKCYLKRATQMCKVDVPGGLLIAGAKACSSLKHSNIWQFKTYKQAKSRNVY